MINTADELGELLQGSFLADQPIRSLPINASDQIAFILYVDRDRIVEAWQLFRSHLTQTQRYPVITEGWGAEDFFSRFYYQEEQASGHLHNIEPAAIMASAATVDVAPFLTAYQTSRTNELEDLLQYSLVMTQERFNLSPEESQLRLLINNQTIQSHVDLEQWFLDWELHTFGNSAIAPLDTHYLDWFEPYNPQSPLLLLPCQTGWDALAYLHWFGACSAGTPVAIALLNQWHQQYDAELVCHYGTMLQFNVGNPPKTIDQAFQLACQQDALAPCTTALSGVSLRDHARSLVGRARWFLHERP